MTSLALLSFAVVLADLVISSSGVTLRRESVNNTTELHHRVGTHPDTEGERAHASLRLLVLGVAIFGGVLHGCAMALKKYFGAGNDRYYREPRWWAGAICDGIAGLCCWPAMPLVPVEVFLPLTLTAHVTTGFCFGIFFWQERVTTRRVIGLFAAVAGVFLLVHSNQPGAESSSLEIFWHSWTHIHFLIVNGCILAFLAAVWPFVSAHIFLALVAAYFDGLQFLCSRCVSAALLTSGFEAFASVTFWYAASFKLICIVFFLHTQQLALEDELSSIAAIFPAVDNLMGCMLGVTFFGERVIVNPSFMLAFSATLTGLFLLGAPSGAVSAGNTENASDAAAKLVPAPAFPEPVQPEWEPDMKL